jgi:hypothetical protein
MALQNILGLLFPLGVAITIGKLMRKSIRTRAIMPDSVELFILSQARLQLAFSIETGQVNFRTITATTTSSLTSTLLPDLTPDNLHQTQQMIRRRSA